MLSNVITITRQESNNEIDKIWKNINFNIERTTITKFASFLFKTVSQLNNSKTAYTSSYIISQLLNIPFPIGDRIFHVLHPKHDNEDVLSQSQFTSLLEIVYCGSIFEKSSFFFNILDFDEDGIIHLKDMQMFFLHLEYSNYQRRSEEFQNMMKDFFEEKITMNLVTYNIKITTNPDAVLLFYYLLSEKSIITENVLYYFNDNVISNQIENDMFLRIKSINALKHPSLETKSAYSKKQKLRRMVTRDSNCESINEDKIKDTRNGENSNLFLKIQTTRKYSPTKRLYDLLGGKNGQFTLTVSDESFYRTTKATHDLVDENEVCEYIDDFESLVSFENDVKAYFDEFNNGAIDKDFPYRRTIPNIDTKRSRRSASEGGFESNTSISNKGSLEMNKCFELKHLDTQNTQKKYNAVEFDLVLFQKGIKTKLVVIDNFVFVYYLKENKSKVTEKLRKIILLKNSFMTIGSKGKVENKTPFSYMLTIYFLEKKFVFCFFSESKRKKFIKLFESINIYNPTRDFFEDYEQKEILGEGHFGKIHIVESKRTHKTYVAKTINKLNSSLKEIEWEIYISGFLCVFKHPNIISFEDIYYTYDTVYIVMEYVPSGSLCKYLFQLSKSESDKVCLQVISAINFLHSNSIMHRDIKLENIVIDMESKNVKIIDFGLSRVNFPTEKAYECCGTISYSAPEVIEGGPYDMAVDIWSYGVILYLIQFNKFPIESKIFDKLIIKGELFFFFIKMEEKGKKYWEENIIKKLIHKTLIKDAKKRYSGEEIEKMLMKEVFE